MFHHADPDRSIDVGFYLARRFSIVPFINAIEPLRMANLISGRELFRWTLISNRGQPVEAVNGMTIAADCAVRDATAVSNLICVVGFAPIIELRDNVRGWLRGLCRHGTHLGALGAGTLFLAEAGLLDGYRATIHWRYHESFRERFPDIDVTQNLFEIDRNRLTCAGGTAAMDMMIHIIGRHFGHDLASSVAEMFVAGDIRRPFETQQDAARAMPPSTDAKIVTAIDLMQNNIEHPLPIAELAARTGVSQRQMERLFRAHFDQSPVQYYVRLRLNQARRLLLQSRMSIIEIGLASGFASHEHFSRSYKAMFGRSPLHERTAFSRPAGLSEPGTKVAGP